MSSKDNSPQPPIVTWIEDPFGIKTQEIFELQNQNEELPLDSDFVSEESAPSLEPTQTLEPTQEIMLDREEIQSCMEALLFISDQPISLRRLHELLGPAFDYGLFQDCMTALCDRYQAIHHGIELVEVGGGYQFRTKAGRSALAQKLVKVQTQKLSSGAMESLAIIAYQQPIMKEEIDKIRGVDSSYFIRNLLEKKLIKITGRSELPGRPMLYSTTEAFLELFGLKELSSLPSLREVEQMIPASESENPEYEDPRVREMRRLVGDMNMDKSSALHYNPKEDERILKEIREKVAAIHTSTPSLDALEAAEKASTESLVADPLTTDPSNPAPGKDEPTGI